MKITKFVGFVQLLKPEERKALADYLKTEASENERTLYKLISKNVAAVENRKGSENLLDSDALWRKAFPEKKIPEKKSTDNQPFKDMTLELMKHGREFLILYDVKKNETLKNRLFFEALEKRGVIKNLSLKAVAELETPPEIQAVSSKRCLDDWQLQEQLKVYYEAIFEKRNEKTKENFTALSDALDAFYIVHKLCYICHARNYERAAGKTIDISVPKPLLDGLSAKPDFLQTHLLVHLYYKALQLSDYEQAVSKPDLEDFWNLLKQVKPQNDTANSSENGQPDLEYLTTIFLNRCKKEYHLPGVELFAYRNYLYAYKHSFFRTTDTRNGEFRFKNIVKTGLGLVAKQAIKIEEIEAFVNNDEGASDYAKLPKISTEMLDYCNALIAFAKGNYKDAYALAKECDFTDTYNKHDASCLKLRVLFLLLKTDSSYEKSFIALCDSLRKAISAAEMKNTDLATYDAFFKIMPKLYRFWSKVNTQKADITTRDKLLEVVASSNCVNKEWLREQISELSTAL